MIVDANLLLYARNADDERHEAAATWLADALNGPTRVGLPWQSLHAFVRIATNPRAFPAPLTAKESMSQLDEWIRAPSAWIPQETPDHQRALTELVSGLSITGPLVADAALAALAIEHGVPIYSTDSDFARFPTVTWVNPLTDA